jgi:hypothetical protein
MPLAETNRGVTSGEFAAPGFCRFCRGIVNVPRPIIGILRARHLHEGSCNRIRCKPHIGEKLRPPILCEAEPDEK